jgi:hypothetical protein
MTTPDDPVPALEAQLRAACTEDCRLYHARKLIRARYERGDYSDVIVAMPDWLAEALAEQQVRVCE